VPVETSGPYFVLDLREDLLDIEPYAVDDEFDMLRFGVISISRGITRGYYVFKDHDSLKCFLYHLHAGWFSLVRQKPYEPGTNWREIPKEDLFLVEDRDSSVAGYELTDGTAFVYRTLEGKYNVVFNCVDDSNRHFLSRTLETATKEAEAYVRSHAALFLCRCPLPGKNRMCAQPYGHEGNHRDSEYSWK
jgi:hypothetical protein